LEPISVIFVDMPRMVREIVKQAVEAQGDMQVVAELETPAEAVAVLGRASERVIVVGDSRIGGEDVDLLLRRAPASAVLAVSASGDRLDLFRLRPVRVRLGEASPRRLVEAIRAAAGSGGRG
jgi:DNA-binding NarL/FixJ family response regulator